RRWALDSHLAASADAGQSYNNLIRSGEFRLWPGCSEDLRPYLVPGRKDGAGPAPPAAPPVARPPDTVLDAPVTLNRLLPIRGGRPVLFPDEVLAAVQREIRRPLMLDPGYPALDLPRGASPEFQWRRRPLRALLQRMLPGWQASFRRGTIFLRDP